jgi:hypothetical protein
MPCSKEWKYLPPSSKYYVYKECDAKFHTKNYWLGLIFSFIVFDLLLAYFMLSLEESLVFVFFGLPVSIAVLLIVFRAIIIVHITESSKKHVSE